MGGGGAAGSDGWAVAVSRASSCCVVVGVGAWVGGGEGGATLVVCSGAGGEGARGAGLRRAGALGAALLPDTAELIIVDIAASVPPVREAVIC